MVLLLIWLLQTVTTNIITNTVPSNPEVSATQTINITIFTTQSIASGGLTIILPPDFAIQAPCKVNATTSTCTYQTSVTAAKVTFSSNSFATSTYYTLQITVTNPMYSDNFLVTATASGTSFSTSSTLQINPKSITCSMTSESADVGDITPATLTLQNTVLPLQSFITINSAIQTTFSNLFASNPSCSTPSGIVSCSLSLTFGQQYLSITSIPTSASLVLIIKNINNAPYNGSLITANLQIKNKDGKSMQICSFSQPAPTILKNSSGVSLTNWNSTVGATSDVTLTINTYFTPYTTKILWIYSSEFTITALTPTLTDSFSISGSLGNNYMSGGVASGKSLSYLARITNPTSKIPLLFTIYVIYSTSLFIETYQITNLKLTTEVLTVGLTLSITKTMNIASYNVSTNLGFALENSPLITVSVQFGTIQCSVLTLTSNAGLTVHTCSSNSLTLTAATITQGDIWIAFKVLNYFSVRPDNAVTLALTAAAPNYYQIGSGSTPLVLIENTSPLTITNNNPTFASTTTFIISEPTVTLSSVDSRLFTITLPLDIQINSSVVVTSNSGSTVVDNYTIAGNVLTITVRGALMVSISNIANPKKYLGSIKWTIKSTDLEGNPASTCEVSQSPFYTPASASVTATFSVPKIQTTSNLTLSIIPALQYSTPPNITVTLPTELITSPCTGCYLLSANSITFLYSATIMTVTFQVNNSVNPTGNTMQLSIAGGGIDYEQKELSFTLEPMTFQYVSTQSGFFGQLGTISIVLTKSPTTPITLSYSGLDSLLTSVTCTNCTNSQIIATGLVKYFQAGQVALTGTANGITYATVQATVYYICSSIQGCRICSSSSGSLVCQMCFNSTYTNYNLLYNAQCLQACPLATYSNGVTCLDCPQNCQSCKSAECQLCYLGYYVYGGGCLDSCPEPLIDNGTHCITVPIVCPSNCANCPSNNKCTACEGGYYLLQDTCYATCPTSYYPDSTGTTCLLFIPPQETKYFPFAFLISAVVLTIALISIKCYQKRSLVMGNLIAFLSIVEIGSMLMTLVYTFKSQQEDLFTQALIFVLLLSKVLLNIIFLIYFLKVIVDEQDFQNWRDKEESHERLYRVLIVMSSLLSFQCIRILYSRLMGLRLFFGKFNTALIFKPLNYFTASHFLTSGVALVILSVRNIIAQDGYKTSIFYSSLESIILEGILLLCCIIDNKRGYDDQFFQYQVYKVKNEYEGSHIEPVEIQEQVENGGSMHEIMSVMHASSSPRNDRSSLIVRNPMWVPRGRELKDAQIQIEEEEDEKDQGGVVNNKKESLFRRRIIDDWREVEKTLPRHVRNIRVQVPKNKPGRKKVQQSLKKSASVEHIQVRLPEAGTLPERIKQYFYNLSTAPPEKSDSLPPKQRKLNRNSQIVVQNDLKSASMDVQRDYNSAGQDDDEPDNLKAEDKTTEDINVFLQRGEELHSNSGYQPEIEELEEIEGQTEEEKGQELNGQGDRQYQSSNKLSNNKLLVDYRYEQGEEKEKRYRTRKRRVNRQTEGVYLQRLVGSSDRKVRPQKARKIEF